MKKFTFIAVAALALSALTACDEYTLPNPPAQSNEPEVAFNNGDLTVTNLLNGTLNLGDYTDGQNPEVLKYEAINVPQDRSIKFVMEISADEEYAESTDVATLRGDDGIVSVSAYDLQEAYNATISREPVQSTLYVRFKAYMTNASGSESIRIGGLNNFYCVQSVNFTPVLLGHVVETSYYMIGSFNNFQTTGAVPLIKSNEGNPYDEPDFYLPFQVSAEQAQAGFSWAIIPGSAYEAGNLNGAFGAAPNAVDNPLVGSLVMTDDVVLAAGQVPDPGSYMLKVNMYDLKYSVALAYEFLYVKANGYYPQYDKMLRLFTDDYVNYNGVVRTSGKFRLACQASDSGLFYGEAEDSEAETNGLITTGKLQSYADQASTPALSVPNGFFYCKANIKDLEWQATQIENISIVGVFSINGKAYNWNEKAEETTMTPDRYMVTYTFNNVTFEAGNEFKFNCNKTWDLSFGGEFTNIVENGGNLKVEEAGTYDITLDFTTIPYSVKMVKK